tara:strand:+ start:296 stop:709 length:414 start_codon:yes stop_codon:yes gene_type:complete
MKRGILLFAAILAFVFLISCFRVEAGEVSTTVSEYGSQLYAELLWITVIGGLVIGGVYFGWKMRYKLFAPQPLPRTQCEESSNQEEEPPEQPKKHEGLSMVGQILVVVAIAACVPLIYLCVILFPIIVYIFTVIFGG